MEEASLLFKLLIILNSGFEFELRQVTKEKIEEAILAANVDKSVHGIIVYYPIFPKASRQDQYIQQLVSLDKDVEGLTHKYTFNMYQNIRFLDPPHNERKSILPCTSLAVVKVLEHLKIYHSSLPYGNRLYGRTITVINRSEVVGRPLAALLANDGAKVYSVDIDGVQLFTRGKGIKNHKHEVLEKPGWTVRDCLPISSVVISGVPGDYKIDSDFIKDGATCINISSEKNFDAATVKDHAAFYVPAIGKVTIAVLLRNLCVSIFLRPFFFLRVLILSTEAGLELPVGADKTCQRIPREAGGTETYLGTDPGGAWPGHRPFHPTTTNARRLSSFSSANNTLDNLRSSGAYGGRLED
jgi:methylenetetrahydrofolate dehydrogenase (NAD+)